MNIYEKALSKFGPDTQYIKCIEEMAELTKELAKIFTCAESDKRIAEELADVIIVIEQMKILYPSWKEWEFKKLKRLEKLVGNNRV